MLLSKGKRSSLGLVQSRTDHSYNWLNTSALDHTAGHNVMALGDTTLPRPLPRLTLPPQRPNIVRPKKQDPRAPNLVPGQQALIDPRKVAGLNDAVLGSVLLDSLLVDIDEEGQVHLVKADIGIAIL